MTYVITEACIGVKDRACVDVCPVDCIYEGEDQLYIHPDECIDCGACEPECPVEAIYYEDDLPEEWADYGSRGVEYVTREHEMHEVARRVLQLYGLDVPAGRAAAPAR